jgi:predicted neutral ceramidase superfamily lipid hydrolase
MAGDVKIHYCVDCHNKKVREDAEREERSRIAFELEQKEREKQKRYEYLKREVALRELEEKAKKLGIG